MPVAIINTIIEQAKTAPSGVNTQPWNVTVVTGKSKKNLSSLLEEAFRSEKKPTMGCGYYPTEWKGEYKARRKACGLLMYSTLGITREDKQRQLDQWAANYRAFDAPVMLLFFIDKVMEVGSYMDYGMFLQSIMLSAVEYGLSTCPQAALGKYPDLVRQELFYSKDRKLVCGMVLGYEDKSSTINSYRAPCEELNNMVRYFP